MQKDRLREHPRFIAGSRLYCSDVRERLKSVLKLFSSERKSHLYVCFETELEVSFVGVDCWRQGLKGNK